MVKISLKVFSICLISILFLSTNSAVKAGTWLIYDDGEEDGWTCVNSGEYDEAVKFTLPEGCEKAELLTVSLFKTDSEISGSPGESIITVLGSDFSTELGSFEVYLEPPGGVFRSFNPPEKIIVPSEFYIVLSGNPEACIGTDDSSGGHSYWKDGEWVLNEYETMVRAEIECILEPVGGELLKGAGSLTLIASLVMVPLIGVTGYIGYKRKDLT